ncbi:putative exonuclease V, mitochondrial, partial [Leucoagaricus sp. SymC.cos]
VSETDVDEFAAFDFSEFTEEDFARIDADIAQKHLPKVTIDYETFKGQNSSHQTSKRNRTRDSPLEAFRPYGTLSVTDLASPSWCEVQFEYGLRGKRSRPLYQRPKSFRSASGKEIKTDTAIAATNDVVTRTGQAIHKALEREIRPKEVVVEIMSSEERWALRLVNMLACLREMRLEGLTREMPVFGIENGEIIVGIIDELAYQRASCEADGGKRLSDPSQTHIESHFPPSDSNSKSKWALSKLDSFTLQIIDTKTRKRPSLPLAEDTLPSRLQLMLYHRLLSRLVSPDASFDFMVFWQLASVDPHKQLSWRFLEQAGLIADANEFQVLNLADLSVLWQDLVHQLCIAGVDDKLKLIYRLQMPSKREESHSLLPRDAPQFTSPSTSLDFPPQLNETNPIHTDETTSVPAEEANSQAVEGPDHDVVKKQRQILGTNVFDYNPELISSHLADILAWWRGERKPKGVPVELARRCATCEYYGDCEWREERAREFREQLQRAREASNVAGK